MRTYRSIAFEDQGDGVTLATIRHPAADEGGMWQLTELCQVIPDLGSDEQTRVIVLTGQDGFFFLGPSLEAVLAMREDPSRILAVMEEARRTIHHLIDLDKPLVAAVNGPAIGVGTQVAFLADVVLACDEAWFRDTHTRIGVAAGDGGALIWPLLMGFARAKRYLLSGDRLSAREAHELGIVAAMVARDELAPAALAYARRLAKLPDFAVRSTKRALHQWLRQAAVTAYDFSWALQLSGQFTPEARSALRSLLSSQPSP